MITRRFDLIKELFILTILGIMIGILSGNCPAVTSASEMRDYLVRHSIFSSEELLELENGGIAVKLLPTADERDVAVCGLVLIKVSPEIGLRSFNDTMARENKASLISMGKIGETPKIEDLNALVLDDGDIEDIKVCSVGRCGVRLSASMIERFRNEINWDSDNYSQQVNNLYRKMILEYVQTYRLKGNQALIEYRDKRQNLRLQDEQESLLENLLWINEFAPEFSDYLMEFPARELKNVKNSVNWSKIKFGLKPVVVITHTSKYKIEKDGVSQILSVSKQIYASHYFDSSLGLTALISFANGNAGTESFLFYTNHSRSTSIGGALSKFKHKFVDQEAINKVEPMLRSTRSFAEFRTQNDAAKSNMANEPEVPGTFFERYGLILLIVLSALMVIVIWIGKKVAKT